MADTNEDLKMEFTHEWNNGDIKVIANNPNDVALMDAFGVCVNYGRPLHLIEYLNAYQSDIVRYQRLQKQK